VSEIFSSSVLKFSREEGVYRIKLTKIKLKLEQGYTVHSWKKVSHRPTAELKTFYNGTFCILF
jgi:hypothetical protein